MRSGIISRGVLVVLLTVAFQLCIGQKTKDVYVDDKGVMRWGDSKQEVYGFGINYTAPFAHAYRSAGKLNVDLEKAIEQDVYHFARLGFDAFRVHVWDTEISDSLGNLLENDHLKLFDFTLAKMKARGIKLLLTPIAFWNNGYPEKDDKTPGFATKYGKDACLVNADAIKAQENYLYQFLNHVNPYTGIAYKNDPDIVAVEISNEPHHRGTPEEVQAYINRMAASMRKTGCKKVIFYNVSHSVHLGDAYFKSNIEGGTFQWYPTGLGAQHELRGNFLPNVDRYTMPFNDLPSFKSKAKVVYEFDAADVGRSYIYPAMARSFREAGIQWATHFAYDPTFLAYANTEYNTHYMNLLYAPQKALSLKLAGEVFHRVPRYKSYGRYPANATFDGFRVSYEEDLAEFVNDKKFIYTNNTSTQPANPMLLQEVSGYGNSNIVKYNGKGAYFLDKVGKGIWRLEVYPDAVWVKNIFGRNSLDREVAVLKWNEWPIGISLPDLGINYSVVGLTNEFHTTANGESFNVKPGVYILTQSGVKYKINPKAKLNNIVLDEFGAEEKPLKHTYLIHKPLSQITENKSLTVTADIVTAGEPSQVRLFLGSGWGVRSLAMEKKSAYTYEVVIPAEQVRSGFLSYNIAVTTTDQNNITFPSGSSKLPSDWDFGDNEAYTTTVIPDNSPLYLFNATTDADEVSREWRRGSGVIPVSPGVATMLVTVPKLFVRDDENLHGKAVHDYSLRYNFKPNIGGRKDELKSFRKIVVKGNSIGDSFPLQIALVDRKGNCFGATVQFSPDQQSYAFEIDKLVSVKHVTLPRPYPTFLPYFFEPSSTAGFDINDVETIQVSVGPGIAAEKIERPEGYKFVIESIRLEK